MRYLSRYITGGAISVLSIWFIFSLGLASNSGVDWVIVFAGFFFLAIGVFIIFNKKEDDIEEINK